MRETRVSNMLKFLSKEQKAIPFVLESGAPYRPVASPLDTTS